MSSRGSGRKRGRPPKYTVAPRRSNVTEKPKWLLSRNELDDNNPSIASLPVEFSFTSQSIVNKHISATPFKMRGRKPMKNRGGKAFVPSHRSLFKESDSHSDVLCGEPPIQQAYLKHESDDLETSNQEDQEDSPFCLRRKAVVHRKSSILTPLLCIQQSNVPSLTLPQSSDDLLLPIHQVLPACDVYEVLRKFGQEVGSGNVFFLFSITFILFLIPGETLPVPFRGFHGFIAI